MASARFAPDPECSERSHWVRTGVALNNQPVRDPKFAAGLANTRLAGCIPLDDGTSPQDA